MTSSDCSPVCLHTWRERRPSSRMCVCVSVCVCVCVVEMGRGTKEKEGGMGLRRGKVLLGIVKGTDCLL